MSDRPAEPPQRVPPEPLRRIDWLAVAPWLILLRAPQATLGWPLVIGSLGSLLLGGFGVEAPAAYDASHAAFAFAQHQYGLWDVARGAVWITLGLVITRLAAPALWGYRGFGIRKAMTSGLRALPATLGALLGLIVPPAFALLLLGFVTGWAVANVATVASGVAVVLAAPLIAAIVLVILGGPLALGAAAVDNADAFDAASRTLAYTTQRLGRAAFYVGLAVAVGYVVSAPIETIILLTQAWLANAAPGASPELLEPMRVGSDFGVRLLRGFYPAYFFTAATAIYLLLRQDVDGQSFDEVPHADA